MYLPLSDIGALCAYIIFENYEALDYVAFILLDGYVDLNGQDIYPSADLLTSGPLFYQSRDRLRSAQRIDQVIASINDGGRWVTV